MMNVILSAAKDLTVGKTVLLYLMISDEEKMRGLMFVAGFAGLRYKKNARLENLFFPVVRFLSSFGMTSCASKSPL
jgi:hypothetical protein